jgi:hypothetical protein
MPDLTEQERQREMDRLRSEFLQRYLCRPPKPPPDRLPETRLVKEFGLMERVADCPLCGKQIPFNTLFGYFGHTRSGAPTFEDWVANHA